MGNFKVRNDMEGRKIDRKLYVLKTTTTKVSYCILKESITFSNDLIKNKCGLFFVNSKEKNVN